MAARRLALSALTMLLLLSAVVPVWAGSRRHHAIHRIPTVTVLPDGFGTLIALTYGTGLRQHVRLLHSVEPIERVAIADVDNDGDFDVLAAPHDGGAVMLWRNRGHGRFALATLPRAGHRVVSRGPRFVRVRHADDGWQWGDDRHNAAMPRAPNTTTECPVVLLRTPAVASAHPVAFRLFSGRAPPRFS